MAELHEIEVTAAGWRADKLIAEALPELSRSAVQNLIRDGHVTCDNKIVQKSTKLARERFVRGDSPKRARST